MNERRNVPEIVIVTRELLRRSQTRIDLLFTMSKIPQARPSGPRMRSDVSQTIIFGNQSLASNGQPVLALSSFDVAAFATIGLTEPQLAQPAKAGGARRDRTDDLMLAKHALSQLSYGPVPEDECFLSRVVRSPSPALRRSSLRSRRPAEPKLQSSEGWWAWEDLNFRPHAYQARALTN
jgi:hypothetical protein